MAKKLADITDAKIPPQALEAAKKAGVVLRTHDPERLLAFAEGRITLGELEGITKDAQYQMAKVGYDYLTEGKLDLAKKVFDGLFILDPFDAYFNTALGSIAQRGGNLEEADARYSRALEINPFFPSALANRGEVRLAQGRLDEAISDFAKAIKEDPNGNEQATGRARVLIETVRRQLEAAAKDPKAAIAAAKAELEATEKQGKGGAKAPNAKAAAAPAKTDPKAKAAPPPAKIDPKAKTVAPAKSDSKAKAAPPPAKSDPKAKAAPAKPAPAKPAPKK